MPKTLAEARTRLTILTEKPANLEAITLAELSDGVEAACFINKSSYRLSPTASDTVAETEMCNKGNGTALGAGNYEGTLEPFWYLDSAGKPETGGAMDVWDLLKEKGATLWFVEREGPEQDVAWAAGDLYEVYEAVTDSPQKPSDRFGGYIKRTVVLGVSNYETGAVAAA